MNRIYIFTGKGGVGKSSVAASHAIKSANEGKKTLLVSTDMAHNLGDLFEKDMGRTVEKEVLPNLDLYEIDPEYVMDNDFPSVMEYLGKLFSDLGEPELQNMGMIPGMEELFSLLKIADVYKKGYYDRIIVDCAPTGETLSLLKFPELLSWYMEKLFPIGKVGVRVLAPISKAAFKVEMPNRYAMNEIETIYLKLADLQELLKNRDITSVRIVAIPEKMVVEETKRSYMYLNLYNFNVDGLYINRILPAEIDNPFFSGWLTLQRQYITLLQDCFGALPIYEIPWYDEELKGEGAIRRIVEDVLDGEEVFALKNVTERESFRQTEIGYHLEVFLPNGDKEKMELYQGASDIVIKTDNFKRNIPLPNVLRNYNVSGAKYENEKLSIWFERGSEEHGQGDAS